MSLYIDKKFVSLISTKLERFQQKNDYLWNCRCPFCGDSRKNKLKARGYFYRKRSNISYVCHNCHASMSLGNFLKSQDASLYRQYQLERYKEESSSNVARPDFSIARTKPVFAKKPIDLPTIASLPDDHIAKQYCVGRKLPRLDELYYAEDFLKFCDNTFPNHGKSLLQGDQRLIIPFLDENDVLQGVQGRSIGLAQMSKMRYITIKRDESFKKVFGLNKCDLSKPILVVEGPLDSMFLKNALATMDSSLVSIISLVGDHDYIFVHDNEPRNKEIVKQIGRSIESGKKVVIWPESIKEKDINDMILAGHDVNALIEKYIYQGLRAKLEYERWRKI